MRKVRLSKASLGQEEIELVTQVLKEEYLGMGIYTQQFEKLLSDFLGREAVCVATGTGAVQLGLQAVGVGPGDEVLVQSLTYVATYQAITALGAIPISCEVDPGTLTLDVTDARKKCSAKTKAIVPVHYSGGLGEIDGIYELAREKKLRVVEDAAHAFGGKHKGKFVGSFGDVVCFSFDGIKNITSGEGGAITSSDPQVIKKIKDLRLLAVENDTEKRYSGQRSWSFDVHEQGWRYHMSNVMAAIGIAQVRKIDVFSEKRRRWAQRYVDRLCSSKDLQLLNLNYREVTPHIFVVRTLGKNAQIIRESLEGMGVQTGKHYFPNHRLSYFKKMHEAYLPVTDKIFDELITLPLHVDLVQEDVDYVCDKLLEILAQTKGS